MAQPDPVFLRAFDAVRCCYGVDEWLSVTPQRITKEIYQEMRRFDLVRAEKFLLRSGNKKTRARPSLVTRDVGVGSQPEIRQPHQTKIAQQLGEGRIDLRLAADRPPSQFQLLPDFGDKQV